MLKKVIFDCDNTMGIEGYPMDDALAFLYVLGNKDKVDLLGFTCTFANGTAQEVYRATSALLRETGRRDIPLLRGAESGDDPRTEEARFIVDTVNARPGEVTLAAIGSLTNLYGAYLLDHSIFEKAKEIILMGGYTAPVLYHGFHLEELNFSVNPKAAACVLNHGRNISILTGNNTLEPSYLPKEEFIEKMCSGSPSGRYIAEKCGYRFDDKAVRDGDAASYCWDVVATVYLLHPELFEDEPTHCAIKAHALKAGWLAPIAEPFPGSVVLNLPRVKGLPSYREEMYSGWLDFRMGEVK